MFFAPPGKLKRLGVVGLNQRNGDYISKLNRRSDYPKVDNKLITKQLAVSAGIAVPELYAVVETNHDAQRLASLLAPYQDFVIKPAHGSGGEGIVVVDGRQGKLFRKASGQLVTLASLEHHVGNILSGMYSLGGQPDHAMIEYRVRFDPLFKDITFQGVPDIRTIVFKGYPVMAMVRLPTRTSDGKANLHQGAVGAGINIATGVTHHGVFNSLKIDHHPDTGHPIGGHAIPQWDVLLRLLRTDRPRLPRGRCRARRRQGAADSRTQRPAGSCHPDRQRHRVGALPAQDRAGWRCQGAGGDPRGLR